MIVAAASTSPSGAWKPDSHTGRMPAARELDVPVERCWFVGDHPVNDVAGAHAAGMRAIWLRGFHDWPDGAAAMPTIASLAELDALILR